MLVITLTDTHYPFMRHSPYRHKIQFLGQVDIACSYKFVSFRKICFGKLGYGKFLRLTGQSPSCPKFGKRPQLIFSVKDSLYFVIKTLFEAFEQFLVIVCHSEIHFIYNGKGRDLVHRGIKPRSLCFDGKTALRIRSEFKIFKSRLPEPEKINI